MLLGKDEASVEVPPLRFNARRDPVVEVCFHNTRGKTAGNHECEDMLETHGVCQRKEGGMGRERRSEPP
jgi:hypothetical protein